MTPDAHFINDLGLDSLDQVEIAMSLEEEFNIEIPDKDAEQIFTVRQAVEKVRVFKIKLILYRFLPTEMQFKNNKAISIPSL